MKFLKWFLKFFENPTTAPRDDRLARVKFLEGTEMLCPHCATTIAIARRDIYYGSVARSSDWDVKDSGFWFQKHCGQHIFGYHPNGSRSIYTPTGWVG